MAVLLGRPATACPTCRVSDPVFDVFGRGLFGPERLTVAFDWAQFRKDQASFTSPTGRTWIEESRFTLTVGYRFEPWFTFVARLPALARTREDGTPEGITNGEEGVGDLELEGLVRLVLWGAKETERESWAALRVGLKVPTGRNRIENPEGDRDRESLQVGTGAPDVFAGFAVRAPLDAPSGLWLSGEYRRTATNEFGYKYGDTLLGHAAVTRALGRGVEAGLGLDYRHAARDVINLSGLERRNSGGAILFVTPRLIVEIAHGFRGHMALRIPAVRNLNGDQGESVSPNLGFSFLF